MIMTSFLHSGESLRCALLRLCFILALTGGSVVARAQSDPQSIVVSTSREPMPLGSATGDVVVIDQAAIRASTADSLEDLLRREAGLQLSRNGGPGQTASLLMRGHSASSLVVLVDGVRMGSASLGLMAFEGLALAQVDRIEVLRGAASSLWGADAVGGVIRITTRQGGDAARLSGKLAAGNLGSREAQLGASGRLGIVDLAATVNRDQSDGVSAVLPNDRFGLHNPDRDGYVRNAAHVKVGFTPVLGHRVGFGYLESRLNAQYDGAVFNPPTFAPDASPDFRNRQTMRLASVDYRGPLGQAWTQSVQLSRQNDDQSSTGGFVSAFRTTRDQFTWQHRWQPHAQQQWVAAFERLNEKVRADDYLQTYARSNHALVLGSTSTVAAHTLQVDVRHDRNNVFGGVTTGRLGWRMAIDTAWSLRASAGTAFRAPSFNDLYYPGYGVSTVQPERSRNVELGMQWRQASSDASMTLYRSQVRDLIGYESDSARCPADPAYAFGCAGNIARARMVGATLAASHRVSAWRLGATLDLLDAKDTDSGVRLPRRAAHQVSLRSDWTAGAWTLGGALLSVGARPDAGVNLKSYTTVDLLARWRLAPAWSLEGKVNNVGDVAIAPARDYQSPGRQVGVGLRYDGGL